MTFSIRKCVALATAMLLLLLPVSARSDIGGTDYVVTPVPEPGMPDGRALPAPKFKYQFAAAAKWSGPLHWLYNPANAPSAYQANNAAAIAQITAAFSKWTAVCGIEIVHDGETATAPNTVIGGQPDRINVVGWGPTPPGNVGITYSWDTSLPGGGREIADADIILSPAFVTSAAQMNRTVSHEAGHALGLGHSNLPNTLMSGLPDSPYSDFADPQADDVRGCRCMYGPASGHYSGYACSLPPNVDFGPVSVGTLSAARQVSVTNDGNAPLAFDGVSVTSGEFVVTGVGCAPGYVMAPGAVCTIDFAALPAVNGPRSGEAVIATSDGPYRLPLHADGVGVPPPSTNYQGLWWGAPAESESGWGINFAHQGDIIFATWFTYDLTGKALWLSMTATKTATSVYTGALYQSHGPAFNASPFDPAAVTRTAVGTATLTFSDANNGMFAYTVDDAAGSVTQSKSITREVFGPLPTCTFGSLPDLAFASNYQDLWWAAPAESESGWGVNFAHQGDVIYATWFTYDLDGTPMWLVATASKTAPAVYSGTLYRTSGPAFNATPFDPAMVVRTPAGSATLTFSDGNHASFAYTVGAVSQTKPITREVFVSPGTVCQ